jgi:ankyrin repeat protein
MVIKKYIALLAMCFNMYVQAMDTAIVPSEIFTQLVSYCSLPTIGQLGLTCRTNASLYDSFLKSIQYIAIEDYPWYQRLVLHTMKTDNNDLFTSLLHKKFECLFTLREQHPSLSTLMLVEACTNKDALLVNTLTFKQCNNDTLSDTYKKIKSQACKVYCRYEMNKFRPYTASDIARAIRESKWHHVFIALQNHPTITIDQPLHENKTTLCHAIHRGNAVLAQYLLQRGADIQLANTYIFTRVSPLEKAIRNNNIDMAADFLLHNNASTDALPHIDNYVVQSKIDNKDGYNLLAFILEQGHYNSLRCLFRHFNLPEINTPFHNGNTMLDYALSSNSAETIQFLLDKGARKHNCVDEDLCMILYDAIKKNNSGMAKLLVEEFHVDVNSSDNGDSPLYSAFLYKNIPIISLLLENGAYFQENEIDPTLKKVVHDSITHGDENSLQLAVSAIEVDRYMKRNNNDNPLYCALLKKQYVIAQILINNGMQLTLEQSKNKELGSVLYNFLIDNPDRIAMVMQSGFDFNAIVDSQNHNLFYYAITHNNIGFLSKLLQVYDGTTNDGKGNTPFHHAIMYNKNTLMYQAQTD